MVLVIALIKPFRARAVLSALQELDVLGGTVREVMGYNRQKNRLHRYLGSEYDSSYLPKVEVSLFLRRDDLPAAIQAIVGQGRTGRMGDGKIVVVACIDGR